MDIHEYQAKKILSDFGVSIPRGGIAYSPENAEFKAREIGGSRWVVKAQVHSGARGKAGGIILCENELEVAEELLENIFLLEQSNEEVYIQKANILSRRDKHLEAIEMLEYVFEGTYNKRIIRESMDILFLKYGIEPVKANYLKIGNTLIEYRKQSSGKFQEMDLINDMIISSADLSFDKQFLETLNKFKQGM